MGFLTKGWVKTHHLQAGIHRHSVVEHGHSLPWGGVESARGCHDSLACVKHLGRGWHPTLKKDVLKGFLNPYVLVCLASLPLLFVNLGQHALNMGESMYAEVAREMRISGDWVTPRLNGTPHFDKPPLIYWLIALNQSLFGESEAVARWWCAFAAWVTIPVVGLIGRRLYGGRAGWLCSLALATFLGPFIFGRMVMPDPIMSLLVSLAILGYLEGYPGDGQWRGPWCWLFFACLGILPLTKGALGIVVVSLIVGIHTLATGIWRAFLSWRLLPGLGISALMLVPWHAAMEGANPGFFHYFYIREHFMRFSGRRFPPDESVLLMVFLALTVVWTFPWFALLPQVLKRGFQRVRREGPRRGNDLIAFVWIGVVMGIFSFSKSRLEYYSLPALPAFALLIGKTLDDTLSRQSDAPRDKAFSLSLGTMAMLAAVAAVSAMIILGPGADVIFRIFAESWPSVGWMDSPEHRALLERLRLPAMATLSCVALFFIAAWVAARKDRPGLAVGIVSAVMIPFLMMVQWGFTAMEPFQSTKGVAEIVRSVAGPDDCVVYQEPHEYMWVGGITYYTGRNVCILKDPRFDNVTTRRREPPERFLDRSMLRDRWQSREKVVVVADLVMNDVPPLLADAGPVYEAGRSTTHVVLVNQPIASP